MKRLLAALLLTISAPAMADHYDVIEFKLRDDCSLATYLQDVTDFNEWGKGHGYRAEIASKVQHPDLTTLLWIGRSGNAAAFGNAWDIWRNAQANPDSVPAKLNARLDAYPRSLLRSTGSAKPLCIWRWRRWSL